MRGDKNFKGSDPSDPSVYFLFCDHDTEFCWFTKTRLRLEFVSADTTRPLMLYILHTILIFLNYVVYLQDHIISKIDFKYIILAVAISDLDSCLASEKFINNHLWNSLTFRFENTTLAWSCHELMNYKLYL